MKGEAVNPVALRHHKKLKNLFANGLNLSEKSLPEYAVSASFHSFSPLNECLNSSLC
jgi:hypothetical protein